MKSKKKKTTLNWQHWSLIGTGVVAAIVITLVFFNVSLDPRVWAKAGVTFDTPGYDIIVVAGQSNAVGKGIGDGENPGPTADGEDAKIFQIGRFGGNNMLLMPASEPLQFWKNNRSEGKGFAMPFARYYAQYLIQASSSRNIIIVPAAHGETSVLQWLGLMTTDGNSDQDILWHDMEQRVDAALSMPTDGQNRVIAILWQQGEQDVGFAIDPNDPNHAQMPDANTYHDQLTTLVQRFRGESWGTQIPFITGEMARPWLAGTPKQPTKDAFTAAIKTVDSEQAHMHFVDSSGLGVDNDADPSLGLIHFNAQAQGILGQRYFQTYHDMMHLLP